MSTKNPKIAVIQFPGTNCELETARAVERNRMSAELFRWNEKKSLAKFDGVILAGGFSYEDRGRSGLIASKDSLMKEVWKLAKRGGVVFGICNGAQILVETGLVPNFEFGKSALALTRNRRVKNNEVQGTEFYNTWVYIKPGNETPNAFNQFDEKVLRIPIAHAEGRYFSNNPELLEKLVMNGQNAFVYCNAKGEINPDFPTNPNGSVLNLAGVTNSAGNVMSLMPHPERTTVGDPIFKSIYKWLTGKIRKTPAKAFRTKLPALKKLTKPKTNAELFINLKITDNEALSVSLAAKLPLKKFRWFGLTLTSPPTQSSKSQSSRSVTPPFMAGNILEKIIRSGELLNTEKESVVIKFGKNFYKFDKEKGLIKTRFSLPKNRVLALERETSLDESRVISLNHTLGKKIVKNLKSGIIWGTEAKKSDFEKAVHSNFFHHPAAMDLIKI